MDRELLRAVFDKMTPDEEQKARMKRNILERLDRRTARDRTSVRRLGWAASSVFVILLATLVIIHLPFGAATPAYAISVRAGDGGALFTLMDGTGNRDGRVTSVRYVDPRPMLEFLIEGEDIASIRLETENEYVYAVDWTKPPDEVNPRYVKMLALKFEEDFRDYGQIWYRWVAWDMYQWAAEDNFSRFFGYGYEPTSFDYDSLTEQEKLELAAGNGSALGHMNLEDYPDHLKEDVIAITITDRQGRVTKQAIHVRVDNNRIGQTVVTAWLADNDDEYAGQ